MTYFDRWDAQNAVRFFMMCYHEGACDACGQNDDAYCEEYVGNHSGNIYFGVLSQEGMTESEFVFNLLLYCRKYKMYTFGEKFIRRISENSMRPFFHLCQRFYVEGVKDYLSYPNYIRMDEFEPVYNAFWKLDKRHQNMDVNDILDFVQTFSFEIRKRIEANGQKPQDVGLGSRALDTFAQAMYTLTRPLKTYNMGKREVRYRMDENIVEPDE